jgi:integrase
LHRPTGQAVVRIDGRDHYLGRHGSPASHEKYRRRIAEWLTAGGRDPTEPAPRQWLADRTLHEVALAFLLHAEGHYRRSDGRPTREIDNFRDALRPLLALYGSTSAAEFGPLALRSVQDEMVRSGLARTTVNARINRIRRVFRWAASLELVPVAVVQALATVPGLQRWRTRAPEPPAIKPVPIAHVEAVLPHVTRPVAAMIQIQVLTGCRTEEVLGMRGRDFRFGEPNWEYRPREHKCDWRGQDRVIILGPQAREIIRPFLKGDPDAYLFSPRDAVAEHHARRARRCSPPTPSERARRCRDRPGSRHGACYSRRSYRLAIVRACRKAGVPTWTPLQLRHSAASAIRGRYGLETAQLIMGHARRSTTEHYAEPDLAKAHEAMSEIG